MDIKDRLKIARDIQDKCLIHKIECDVKTNFHEKNYTTIVNTLLKNIY